MLVLVAVHEAFQQGCLGAPKGSDLLPLLSSWVLAWFGAVCLVWGPGQTETLLPDAYHMVKPLSCECACVLRR